MNVSQKGVEQVALNHLLGNAYEEFKQSLHSSAARFVLWASFKDSSELQRAYFSAKGKLHLLDGRRSLSSFNAEELYLKDVVERGACEAEEYIGWARRNNGQAILKEMLISYCSAFESCLKNVALVFALAKRKQGGLDDQVFVPGDEFRWTLNEIKNRWAEAGEKERSRAERFFEMQILGCNIDETRFNFLPMNSEEWGTCRASFLARNALVHQLGRPSSSIDIAGQTLHAGWEIELSTKQVQAVQEAFLSILWPISPIAYLL